MNLEKCSSMSAYAIIFVTLIAMFIAASNCFAVSPEYSNIPKSIRVVMDDNYPPYVFKDEQGVLKGIIVDQWKLWEKKTGIHAEVSGMDWGEAQRRMHAGEFDVIDSIFRNEKREAIYDFTKPYARLDVPLFFHKDISGISGADDLKGFLVAAKAGDNSINVLKAHGVTNIAEYPSYEKLIEAARDGKVKVFTVDRPPALYYLNKMGIQNKFRETKPLYYGEFHRAVRKGQATLLSAVEKGFAAISKSDYEAVDKRWMGSSLPSAPYLRYVYYGAGFTAIFVLLLIAWLRTLKRAVSQKTRDLSESEKRHREILRSAINGIWLVDTQGCILEVNTAYCRMSGYSEQELLAMHVSDLEVDESADDTAKRIQMIKERGEAHFEYRHRRKDGTVFDVEASVQYLSEDGHCLAFMQDITERKQHEEAIIHSSKLLQTIINTAPVRIFWKDTDLRYLGCNTLFAKDAGVDYPDELIGKDDFQLAWKDQAEQYRADDRLVMESGNPKLSFDEQQTTPTGGTLWLRTSKVPLRNEENKVTAVLGIYDDITERKRVLEEKLELEKQFQQTQKLESLGVLSGGIAHDFNNILAIIMGYCSLTKMDYETAEENIPEIEKAAERAAGLCRQMLAYAGKAQLSMVQVNMWTLVDEMVTMLKATLPQNSIIKTDLSTNIPFIKADASQLRQIVMNLIINASEAIGTEQGEIGVSLAKTTIIAGQSDKDHQGKTILPGEYICLEVTDTGCGMDEETKWRIFEPFYTTKFTGRGLGMSAVLGIINSHNGALQLFSQQGKGTTFKVYLPVLKSYPSMGECLNPSISAAPWQGSGTILLVEDEDQIRFLAKSMLQRFGFTVLEAANGKEALELYQKNAADIRLVLTDMGMPVMDGYALFPALKKLNPELPIIISSGFGDVDVTSRIGRDNIAGIISKPYNPNLLGEVLKKVWEGLQ
ncbi:MAG: PAS domain S-box protein [Desulfuromonadaceae bacterium]|nr:PAS domain S-box protein [Desulfuromonadaceae bacterium]